MRSALFVDFDNVYSGLRKLDMAIADRFARQPLEWMNWVVESLALPEHAPSNARRRVLVRRCYLNPQAYQRFRPSFNVAGFEIIDCPALTGEGKTSTDIHMVLDIIDLLQHETRYDEFIVFSADADFTPVLRRLRRWDRRTTVLAIGFPSAAYRASADLLIDQDDFVRKALSFRDDEEQGTLETPPAAMATVAPTPAAAGEDERAAITALIRQEVAISRMPVPCARLALQIGGQYAALLGGDWDGMGSFRKFVEALDLEPLQFDWRSSGGWIMDPQRHTPVPVGQGYNGSNTPENWGEDRDLLPVATQIHEVTDAPLLTPTDYRNLFRIIEQDVAVHPFELKETGKRVRDLLREVGCGGSRMDVNWVLRGLLMRGHVFGQSDDSAAALAQKMANSVRSLCLREGMLLDRNTDGTILRWFGCPPTP